MKKIALLLLIASASLHAQLRMTALPAISGANVDPAADLLWLNDTSVGENPGASKKILLSELANIPTFTSGNFLANDAIEFTQINGLQTALDGRAVLAGGNTLTGAQIINHTAATGSGLALNFSNASYSGNVLAVVNTSAAPVQLLTLTQAAVLTVGNDVVAVDDITAGGTSSAQDLYSTLTLETDGNTFLGNDAADTIAFNGTINTDITPFASNTNDLGTSSNGWRDLWITRDAEIGGSLGVGGTFSAAGTISGSNFSGTSSGANTGDQSSIVGITGTLAQFNTAITDGDIQPLDADNTSWGGVTRASGFDTWAGSPTSANLASVLTDEAGTSGGFVRAGSPTLITPNIGAATGTSLSVSGQITTSLTTASSSASTGALVIPGGGAFGANTTISANLLMLPNGSTNRTINFGAGYGVFAATLYDGGAGVRWGWGLQPGMMHFVGAAGAGNAISWSSGGDLPGAGVTTNERMRLVLDNGNLLLGSPTDDTTHKLQVNGGAKFAGPITEGVVAAGTVTTASTLALTTGTVVTATLTASTACTFTMPAATAGRSFSLYLKQAASTGNGTATFTGVKWSGGTAPTITATAGRMDILSFVSDGTNWYGSFVQNFTP